MSEQKKNIVVLGASYAGLSSAQYLLKHVVPALPNKGAGYHVTLVNPSAHWFTRPAAPRAVVSDSLMPDNKTFHSIPEGFKQYSAEQFTLILGTATAADTAARTVTLSLKQGGGEKTLHYHALIIATGNRTYSPALGITTDEDELRAALAAFRKALPSAKSIVIAGGGPAGVETAGEIGEFLNGAAGFLSSRPKEPKAKITLVTADPKLLPVLRPAIAKHAEQLLNRVGVDVVYNVAVEGTTPEGAGRTVASVAPADKVAVRLSNGETLDADIFLPAFGVMPNTEFLPASLLDDKKRVDTNATTLRVDAAGPRVYAVGDVGNHARGTVMEIFNAVPVLMSNVKADLLADAAGGKGAARADRPFRRDDKETHLVPVGRSKGVGAVFGWKLPSFMVWLIKGRDYFTWQAPSIVGGAKWSKESKWKGEA